jgi:drug/metabolite transporter (DMT)-like permease
LKQQRGDAERRQGIRNALLSSFFLGWAPVLGKLAYSEGVRPFTLAAARTLVAVLLVWGVVLIFWRSVALRITWRDLVNCVAVGAVNGVGSLLYYSGLQRLDASPASFLNTLYPLWVVIFLTASGEPLRRLTLLRLAMALCGIYLLAQTGGGEPDWLGAMLMVASAAAYGWHVVMGQWVLADVPAPTAAVYVLTGMWVVVGIARLLQGGALEPVSGPGWAIILALGVTTALSRILMFAGLKRLGGIEASLIGLLELVVSLGFAFLLLNDRLTPLQWLGGGILVFGVMLGRLDIGPPRETRRWWEEEV